MRTFRMNDPGTHEAAPIQDGSLPLRCDPGWTRTNDHQLRRRVVRYVAQVVFVLVDVGMVRDGGLPVMG